MGPWAQPFHRPRGHAIGGGKPGGKGKRLLCPTEYPIFPPRLAAGLLLAAGLATAGAAVESVSAPSAAAPSVDGVINNLSFAPPAPTAVAGFDVMLETLHAAGRLGPELSAAKDLNFYDRTVQGALAPALGLMQPGRLERLLDKKLTDKERLDLAETCQADALAARKDVMPAINRLLKAAIEDTRSRAAGLGDEDLKLIEAHVGPLSMLYEQIPGHSRNELTALREARTAANRSALIAAALRPQTDGAEPDFKRVVVVSPDNGHVSTHGAASGGISIGDLVLDKEPPMIVYAVQSISNGLAKIKNTHYDQYTFMVHVRNLVKEVQTLNGTRVGDVVFYEDTRYRDVLYIATVRHIFANGFAETENQHGQHGVYPLRIFAKEVQALDGLSVGDEVAVRFHTHGIEIGKVLHIFANGMAQVQFRREIGERFFPLKDL